MTSSWEEVLDSLTCQIDLQERALTKGHPGPVDLEIDPPSTALRGADRLRAIQLFERCENMLNMATERAVSSRSLRGSAYGTAL